MNSFEELEAWKVSREIRTSIWIFTKKLPKEETYRMKDQLIRASRSVTANIAEGYGRFHYQENIQFCRQARGSLYEILDHLICAFDCEYLTKAELDNYKERITICLKILNGYISYLLKAKELNKPINH
jgi:four helix bundle protein